MKFVEYAKKKFKTLINGEVTVFEITPTWFCAEKDKKLFFGHNKDEVQARARRYQPKKDNVVSLFGRTA